MTALEKLFVEIEKHDIMRAHSSLIVAAREEFLRLQRENVKSFYDGVRVGVTRFAWWSEGEQQVGTCGKTLKEAIEDIRIEERYAKP